jgi:prepilin-type N-terminal cleavage/methylation domain-containing protein
MVMKKNFSRKRWSEEAVKMRVKNKEPGFSLVEVLVALTILSLGLLAVARLQVAAINSLSYSRHLSTATQIGQEYLEFLRTLPFEPLSLTPIVDQDDNPIVSNLNGSEGSPFRDNSQMGANAFGDGIPSGWHSHINNPLNPRGERAARGEMQFFVRWTVERGPNVSSTAFPNPGIKQLRIHLQVIWWDNPKRRPDISMANPHPAVQGWSTQDLKDNGARWIDLETTRQVNL